jgi:prepilin-type N-terminal cleavage/methylation domain-containing protein
MKGIVQERLVRDERGFTLVEMMVTIMVMIVALFALHSIFDMSMRVFSFGNDKIEAVQNARLGLEKMEREIRAAYPVDRIADMNHVFFTPGFPETPARPGQQSITFGNDLPSSGGIPPNRKIDPEEEITYELRDTQNINAPCPAAFTQGVCSLVRRQGATGAFQPVIDYVVPNGLTFEYLRSNLTETDPAGNGTDIGVVRIKLEISKDGRRQTLTTDVDLRNRG